MWKLHNFSVPQILREIKIGESRARLGISNCDSTAMLGCVNLTDLGSEGVLSQRYQNVL